MKGLCWGVINNCPDWDKGWHACLLCVRSRVRDQVRTNLNFNPSMKYFRPNCLSLNLRSDFFPRFGFRVRVSGSGLDLRLFCLSLWSATTTTPNHKAQPDPVIQTRNPEKRTNEIINKNVEFLIFFPEAQCQAWSQVKVPSHSWVLEQKQLSLRVQVQ